MSEGAAAIEALSAFALLERVLSGVKGAALRASRPEERLDHLGWLAALVFAQAESWEEALGSGGTAVRRLWEREVVRGRSEPWVCRGVAALYREWGAGALGAGELEGGRRWLEASLELMREVLSLTEPPWSSPAGASARWDAALRQRLGTLTLAEHWRGATGAMDRGALAEATLHWQLLVEFADLGGAEVDRMRSSVASRWVSLSEGLIATGTSRGLRSGYDAALEQLLVGLGIEAESPALHRQLIAVGVRAAMWAHALGQAEAFREVVGRVAPSVYWMDRRGVGQEEVAFRDHLSEAWVTMATQAEHPLDAVAALRRALAHRAEHPTASRLLGQALVAQAARRLGAGDVVGAREALSEGLERLPYRTAELQRLSDAVRAEVTGAARRESSWFEGDGTDEGGG